MTQAEWRYLETTVSKMSTEEKHQLAALLQADAGVETAASPLSSTQIVDFERELYAVTFEAPPLPSDFSRADIYTEHD